MSQRRRQSRGCRVLAKQPVDRATGERCAGSAKAAEEIGAAVIAANREVASQQFDRAREHVVRERSTALEARDVDHAALEAVEGEDRGLAAPQSVQIHDVEEQSITNVLARNRSKEVSELLLR